MKFSYHSVEKETQPIYRAIAFFLHMPLFRLYILYVRNINTLSIILHSGEGLE